jgi:hypothetical protein
MGVSQMDERRLRHAASRVHDVRSPFLRHPWPRAAYPVMSTGTPMDCFEDSPTFIKLARGNPSAAHIDAQYTHG